ncbi:uncharacterized protein GGS22DRAFT_197288 [Annulohypoxylon maeteangense]|uniref:uncharacterized protein n=1 Tax=Annulohypoxylon maeteangense TaxID=1927788 RepID=UPI002008D340|nr:uncharacterized protein GGS22DRAFT_197288 [Annulohypoxylon maeteangense]KAI0880992.1 hypothetical protein GGS22DRAFT_197288 [Annulohypoxylon maeteangense]
MPYQINKGRSGCATWSAQEIYSNAADINFRNPENPRWWFYNDKAEDFLTGPNSAISAVHDRKAREKGRNIAIDSIRFFRDEIKKYRSLTWQDVRDTRPVIFVASDSNHHRYRCISRTAPFNIEIDPQKRILHCMICQFFFEMRPLIPRNWQPWFARFDRLSIGDQLDVLASIPYPISPMASPVDQRLCIIVGLDDAYSQYTHGEVTRFLRIIEQFFIAGGRGKILLMHYAPFDMTGMLKGESNVTNLKKGYCT